MPQLPVYTRNSRIQPSGVVRQTTNGVAEGLNEFGRAAADLAVKWQETQNQVEMMNGANDLDAMQTDLIKEANDFNSYHSAKDLEKKQAEILEKLDKVVPDITSGFATSTNANEFTRKAQNDILRTKAQIEGIFRKKTIDNGMANLLVNEKRNRENFINTGNKAYINNYLGMVAQARQAGIIDATDEARAKLNIDNWHYGFAQNQALINPDATLENLSGFGLDAAKTENVRELAERVIKKRKEEAKKGKTDEEALQIAMTQEVNNGMYEDMWKANDGAIAKDMYSLFEFRNAIQAKFAANELSQKDFQKLQAKTIAPLLQKVSEHSAGNPVFWNTSFDTVIKGVADKVGLDAENDEVKAYVYDLAYSELKEKQIDPNERFSKDNETLSGIVERIQKDYLRNKEPGLLGVEANKVLLGTKLFDYTSGGKEHKTNSYQLMKDANGGIWKVYPDKDGKYTNNSIKERVK